MRDAYKLVVSLIVGMLISTSMAVLNIYGEDEEVFLYGLGCIPEELGNSTANLSANFMAPPSWDWRTYGIMTPVKNQGACGACVAFACNGAFEAIIKWKTGVTVDLSEAHLFFCSGGTCDEGMYVRTALNYLETYGTPDEDCFPYDGALYGTDLSCSDTCDDWQQRAYKIDEWDGVTGATNIKNALVNYGPLIVTYAVYTDFDDYWADPSAWPDQVYYHYYGTLRGYHAVVLVGYDDAGGYWICKNSWGTSGGINGYFKIKYGEPVSEPIDDEAYYIIYEPGLVADAHGPYKAKPGQTIQFYGSASGGTEPYSWYWEFGDGTTSTEQNPTHAYSSVGTYTVKLTVTDYNGQQAVDTTTAIINNPPETPTISGPSSGKVNTALTFTVKSIDPDGDDIRYLIDWGDGRKTTTEFYKSGEGVAVEHTWNRIGKYTIKVQAEDEKESTSSYAYFSIEIGASNPPYKPYNPYPPDNATGVELNPTLSWEGGDPDGETVYYTIYLGEEGQQMTKIADNISETSLPVYGLKPFTRYYWQVVAYDASGMNMKGDIWSFRTKDIEAPEVQILYPIENHFHKGNFSMPWFKTFVLGKINVLVYASDSQSGIEKVEFYVDGQLMATDYDEPYEWLWNEDTVYDTHLLEVIAYDRDGNTAKDSMEVTVFNLFS